MITIPFRKSTIENLSPQDWEGVQELIEEPASIMIYEHEDQAQALLGMGICLNSEGTGLMRMHVYHTCQEEHPVLLQHYDAGFAIGSCPMCKKAFEPQDVEYDLELIVKFRIKLED